MALPEDELRKQLPQTNTTGSPALAGQPASITGQPAEQVPTNLPASPSGGNANVASAPLSQNGAKESQGGAGDSLNLVEDRGTPAQYLQTNVNNLGSDRVMEIAEGSARKARRQATGVAKPENQKPTGVLPAGGAQTFAEGEKPGPGLTTTDVSDEAPAPPQTEMEIRHNKELVGQHADKLGFTDDEKGAANLENGKEVVGNTFDAKLAQDIAAGEITKKEAMIKSKKYQGIFKGMTRHEFSLFLWDWGASVMAHGDKGLRAAGMGAADAIAGHRARIKADQETKAGAAQQAIENKIAQQQADAQSETAAASTVRAQADAERAKYAGMGYQGQDAYLAARYKKEGMSDKEINAILRGVEGTEVRAQKLQDSLTKMMEGAGIIDTVTIGGKQVKLKGMSGPDQKRWIKERLQSAAEAAAEYDEQVKKSAGALPTDDDSAALPDNDPVKSADEYLNAAQTG